MTGQVSHCLRAVPVFPNELFVQSAERAPYSRPDAYAAPGSIKSFEDGVIEAFDCSHTGNRLEIPPLGPAPACVEQPAITFGGVTSRYPRLRATR